MANRSFKVVGRHKSKAEQKSWCRGIPGRQAKKRVYTSFEDYTRHSPVLIERWEGFCNYEVSTFELIDGEWMPYSGKGKGP